MGSSAYDHSRSLLAAIIPDRPDLLERALRDVTVEHIPDRVLANLYALLERYSEIASGGVLTRTALESLLATSRLDAGSVAAYQELYDELAEVKVDEPSFKFAVYQLRELAAERATKAALINAMEILNKGLPGKNDEIAQGHTDARAFVTGKFADIERNLALQDAPEGDMRGEGKDILAEYAARKAAKLAGRGQGVSFGVQALDDRLLGMHPGELVLIVGYTSDGKSSACVQMAWSAVVQQGLNVLFLTTETVRSQIRRRMVARHSCLPMFGAGDGLNSRDIKGGSLSADDERRLQQVVADFDTNPGYGQLYIAQVPRGASMTYVETKIARVGRRMRIDLVIMDYLALLAPEQKRTTTREELSAILKSAKQLSTTANDGEGVPFVSPWQVSRMARSEAEKLGHYTLSGLSETAETSNSADTVIGLLAPLDNEDRRSKVKFQIMKHRDGEKANSIEMMVDYATSRFSAGFQQAQTIDNMFDPLSAFL